VSRYWAQDIMFIDHFYPGPNRKYYFVLQANFTTKLDTLRSTIENLAKTLPKFVYLSVDVQPNSKQDAISIISNLSDKVIGSKKIIK
jgi:hypothetical protein